MNNINILTLFIYDFAYLSPSKNTFREYPCLKFLH